MTSPCFCPEPIPNVTGVAAVMATRHCLKCGGVEPKLPEAKAKRKKKEAVRA